MKYRASDQSSFLVVTDKTPGKADSMMEDAPNTLSLNCLACQGIGNVHSYAGECAKVCPACQGQHRKHTYKEGCKKFVEQEPEKEEPAVTRKRAALGDPDLEVGISGVNKGSSSSSSSAHPEPRVEAVEPPVAEAVPLSPPAPHEEDVKRALHKIHEKLKDETELYKLHLKHYHMTPKSFRHRTSALKLPKEVYDKYEEICKKCEHCQTNIEDHLEAESAVFVPTALVIFCLLTMPNAKSESTSMLSSLSSMQPPHFLPHFLRKP